MMELISILPDKLKVDITEAEEWIFNQIQIPKPAYYLAQSKQEADPATGENWGEKRIVRAAFVIWLCTDGSLGAIINPNSIKIGGFRIEGLLDFENVALIRCLELFHCYLPDGMNLRFAKSRTILLEGCYSGPIEAGGIEVDGCLFWRKMHIKGGINIPGARISGDFACDETVFTDSMGCALNAEGIHVDRLFSMHGINADGEVRLIGDRIGGNLQCQDAIIDNKGGNAINGGMIEVDCSVYLSGKFHAKGTVNLTGGYIGNRLDCRGAFLDNPAGLSMDASFLKIGNDALFAEDEARKKGNECRKFRAEGTLNFASAEIKGNLVFQGCELRNPRLNILDLQGGRIEGTLLLRNIKHLTGKVRLQNAKARLLADDKTSWPERGDLVLNGFEYDDFASENTPISTEDRLKWIRLMGEKPFHTQPYEQLAKVFRNMGQQQDARKVLIAKEHDYRKYLKEFEPHRYLTRCGRCISRWAMGYGYQPWISLIYIAFFVSLGWGLFYAADRADIMHPAKERVYMDTAYINSNQLPNPYPRLEPFWYALDVFLPIVDFHQESYWLPDVTSGSKVLGRPWGYWFRFYFWFHIIMGWIFSTLAVYSFAQLVRKD